MSISNAMGPIRIALAALGAAFAAANACGSAAQDLAAAMRLNPDLERGGRQFQQCAGCHHPTADASAEQRIPRIAGQHDSVLIKQLVEFRQADRQNERMQRVTHDLDLQAIADVAAFASRLQLPEPSGHAPADPGDPTISSYQRHCSSCHGKSGEGSAERALPRLAGQRYDYLLEQIYDVEHGRRRNVPTRHPRVLGKLGVDDLRDIANFLSHLPWNDGGSADKTPDPKAVGRQTTFEKRGAASSWRR